MKHVTHCGQRLLTKICILAMETFNTLNKETDYSMLINRENKMKEVGRIRK